MDTYFYFCHYCGKEYIPKRRNFQKYCSNSCRTNAFVKRNKVNYLGIPVIANNKTDLVKPTKIDTMSLAGVGNAAVGVLAVNLATNLLIREENKPATKRDLQEVKDILLTRYYPILNLPQQLNGGKPFYDLDTQQVVYLFKR